MLQCAPTYKILIMGILSYARAAPVGRAKPLEPRRLRPARLGLMLQAQDCSVYVLQRSVDMRVSVVRTFGADRGVN